MLDTGGGNAGETLKRLKRLSSATPPIDILRTSRGVGVSRALGMGGNALEEAESAPLNGGAGKLLSVNSLCVAEGAILERRCSSRCPSGESSPGLLLFVEGSSLGARGTRLPRDEVVNELFVTLSPVGVSATDPSIGDMGNRAAGRLSKGSDMRESPSLLLRMPLGVIAGVMIGENRRSAAIDLSSSLC